MENGAIMVPGGVRRVVNRLLLTVSGVTLLGLGGWLTVSGLYARHTIRGTPPPWWPSPARAQRWLDDWLTTDGGAGSGGPSTAVLVGLSGSLLALLGWLWAQRWPRRPRHVPLRAPRGDPAPSSVSLPPPTIRSSALAKGVAAHVEEVPGVARARVRVGGRVGHPHVRVTVVLAPPLDPRAVLRGLVAGPLRTVRRQTGPHGPPTTVRLTLASATERQSEES